MSDGTLEELQATLQSNQGFTSLPDYAQLCQAFLGLLGIMRPTRIVSPTHPNYVFFQYGVEQGHKITRPLNSRLFIESVEEFQVAFERFMTFLADLRSHQEAVADDLALSTYLSSREVDKVVYTVQQAIGCVADSFESPNQSRKRVGQLFERLITLVVQQVGLVCEPRVVNIPIPGFPGYKMPYQLDLVISRRKAILTAESQFIHATEIVGSVKTTSKDRIDKVFLDKYLLTRLIGRDIPVVAIFLHDVQRARQRTAQGSSIFAINSTFKTNHFLGYTVALNRLDGVYYVDPRPEMLSNERLREQIRDFQEFLTKDLWAMSTS